MASQNTFEQAGRTRCAVAMTPRRCTRSTVSFNCDTVRLRMGWRPIHGNTSCSSRTSVRPRGLRSTSCGGSRPPRFGARPLSCWRATVPALRVRRPRWPAPARPCGGLGIGVGVGARCQQSAPIVSLASRQREGHVGVGAQGQRLVPVPVAVVKPPAMRATLDEEKQVQAVAVADPLAQVARLDGLERRSAEDQVFAMTGRLSGVTSAAVTSVRGSYCGSFCNRRRVLSVNIGSRRKRKGR